MSSRWAASYARRAGVHAQFYTLVTRDTVDQTFAVNHPLFLTGQDINTRLPITFGLIYFTLASRLSTVAVNALRGNGNEVALAASRPTQPGRLRAG